MVKTNMDNDVMENKYRKKKFLRYTDKIKELL